MAAAELTDADLCLALPSDTELALQILWKDCPPGALVANGLQVALRSQVYGIVNDRTAVLNFWVPHLVREISPARDKVIIFGARTRQGEKSRSLSLTLCCAKRTLNGRSWSPRRE